jgi:hypothetical protein
VLELLLNGNGFEIGHYISCHGLRGLRGYDHASAADFAPAGQYQTDRL